MVLDANDLKQIGELIATATKPAESPKPDPKPTGDPAPKPVEKSTIELAKEKKAAEDLKAQESRDIESATKFEVGFDAFKKDNKEFLPEEMDYILSVVDSLKIENKVARMKEIKASIAEVFFKKEKNINSLNDTQKAKAKKFMEMTREAKKEVANDYWEVLEIAVDALKSEKKFETVRKANGMPASNDANKYDSAIFVRSQTLNIPAKNAMAAK